MSVESVVWGTTESGEDSLLVTLRNNILTVNLTDLGAAIVSLLAPDRSGAIRNVVVGGEEFSTYHKNSSYLGATVGRFANRIGKGRFQLGETVYQLLINNGPNHLHGGETGLTHCRWNATLEEDAVRFHRISPHGEDGYPGTLNLSVTYRLRGNSLFIEYEATTDATTIINLTNHTYWNLAGGGSVLDHELRLNAEAYLENDADVLPTGKILDVRETPFDFRNAHPLGTAIDQTAGGYDNCFLIRDWDQSLKLAGMAFEPRSGRLMSVWTTEPGVQLYTANHFDGSPATGNAGRHEAFCLECQHFPDAPNQPTFPATILHPGQKYQQTTEHRFEARD